jgi:hypothetical protein
MTRCYKCHFDFRSLSLLKLQSGETRIIEPQVIEFQEHLIKAAKQGYVEIQGVDNILAEELFDALHWILSIVIMPHAAANRLRTSIFNYYGITLDCSLLPKEQTLESLSIELRAELLMLLQRLLIDHPEKYFGSSRPRDFLSRIWLDEWRQTSCWRLGVVWAQPAQHTRKVIYDGNDPLALMQRQEIDVLKYSNSYKRLAAQLNSAGFRRAHVARVLRVNRMLVAEWIKESLS